MEMWLFGSALTSSTPNDIDVLIVYEKLADMIALRAEIELSGEAPPLDIIAMTRQEQLDYRFIEGVRACQVV